MMKPLLCPTPADAVIVDSIIKDYYELVRKLFNGYRDFDYKTILNKINFLEIKNSLDTPEIYSQILSFK